MATALDKLVSVTDDPLVLLLVVALITLALVCATLFRAWSAEIEAHRETIQDNIRWTRENTLAISEVRQATERFAGMLDAASREKRL